MKRNLLFAASVAAILTWLCFLFSDAAFLSLLDLSSSDWWWTFVNSPLAWLATLEVALVGLLYAMWRAPSSGHV